MRLAFPILCTTTRQPADSLHSPYSASLLLSNYVRRPDAMQANTEHDGTPHRHHPTTWHEAPATRDRGLPCTQAHWHSQGSAEYQYLVTKVRRAIPIMATHLAIDPLSVRILGEVPPRSLVPAWLLAWTRCRWSELAQIDVRDIREGRPMHLRAVKGSKPRHAPKLPLLAQRHLASISPATPLCTVRYDTLIQDIDLARHAAHVYLPEGAKDKTHLFRHLWASWRAAHGASIEAIADGLGHRSTDSTLHYVHPYESLTETQPQ